MKDLPRITEEQIDWAWELLLVGGWYSAGADNFASRLGIIACPDCNGAGIPPYQIHCGCLNTCQTCYRNGKSHGWVWEDES